MGLLTKIVIATLLYLAIGTMFFTIAFDIQNNYNVSYDSLTNDTNIKSFIGNTTNYRAANNETLTALSYEPGQANALGADPSNPINSIQQTSFVAALKLTAFAITLPYNIILQVGNYIGFDGAVLITMAIIFNAVILLFIGSIIWYRGL